MAKAVVASVKTPARFSLSLLLGGLAAAPAALLPLASSQAAPRVVTDPPLLQPLDDFSTPAAPNRAGAAVAPLAGTPTSRAKVPAQEVRYDLNIVYTDGELYNPATNSNDKVRLRSYQGRRVNPKVPFIAPMITAVPGQTVRISLNNQLPPDTGCDAKAAGNVNQPHCFNSTNLHAHGLWVSPAGNSDNVLLTISPGQSFQYEYNIPSDHPAGTFWYHTHRHGSTALQVSSGMAGALVIRGNRRPLPGRNGDLDTLLKPTTTQSFKERVVVLQQIAYACGDVATKPDYSCQPGQVGVVESYNQFGPGTWSASGRYTSINGVVLPTFADARAGQIERWRLIHGGVRDTINLQFRKMVPDAPSVAGLQATAVDDYVQKNCSGAPMTQYLVAADGLTMKQALASTQTVFQPGYRWDALMVFPEPGTYCVIDTNMQAGQGATVSESTPSRQLLGFVQVGSGVNGGADPKAYLIEQLVAAARQNMPTVTRAKVIADLNNNLGLQSFVPHPDISDAEVTGEQTVVFNIVPNPLVFQIDGHSYDPNRVDRQLTLGKVDQWTLTSNAGSHPFHIHVNPFQVVSITDPAGNDVSAPDAEDRSSGAFDPQYRGLKGVWKDTLWVKNSGLPYKVVVRTRYQRYIGDFVLHCHILDHEDQGMMQNVRISLPDHGGPTCPANTLGQPRGAHAHH
ncbi:MAG: multicopper oxidase family protein [Cyanobium sp.]